MVDTSTSCTALMKQVGFLFVKRMHEQGLIASISVGVKEYEYDFVSQLKADAPEYITIDIAHGHADSVIR